MSERLFKKKKTVLRWFYQYFAFKIIIIMIIIFVQNFRAKLWIENADALQSVKTAEQK